MDCIPPNTVIAMCENLAFSTDTKRREIEKKLAVRNIRLLPGPLLTVGGAAVSRFEMYHRRAYPDTGLPAPSAKAFVRELTRILVREMDQICQSQSISLYDATHAYIAQHERGH